MKRAIIALAACLATPASAVAQNYSRYSEKGLTRELSQLASSELAVPVPMRDSVGLSTNIYRPRGEGAAPDDLVEDAVQ